MGHLLVQLHHSVLRSEPNIKEGPNPKGEAKASWYLQITVISTNVVLFLVFKAQNIFLSTIFPSFSTTQNIFSSISTETPCFERYLSAKLYSLSKFIC